MSALSPPRSATFASPGKRRSPDSDASPSKRQTVGESPTTLTPFLQRNLTLSAVKSYPSSTVSRSLASLTPTKNASADDLEGLVAELETWTRPEHFNIADVIPFVRKLDLAVFKIRKNQEACQKLFTPSFFLRLCELKNLVTCRNTTRNILGILNSALVFTTIEQKEVLFNALRKLEGNKTYEVLIQHCAAKYFYALKEGPGLPSDEQVLRHVIQRSEADFASCTNEAIRGVIQRVSEIAKREWKFLQQGMTVKVDRLFHFTEDAKNIIPIFKNGIAVTHGKTYEGAFVSSHPEPSFGKFGITVSTDRIAAMQSSLKRVERRCDEDNGAVWLGSSQPIKPLTDRLLYTEEVTQKEIDDLKEALEFDDFDECKLVPMQVQELYLKYAREIGWVVPVPPLTKPSHLASWQRGSEGLQ